MVVFVTLVVVALTMLAEQRVSRRHEQDLRARGAVEPSDDVYRAMQVAYPLGFLGMVAEGAALRSDDLVLSGVGIAIFVGAKLLKYWAIVSLGRRWTFRVLVPPGDRLVAAGPYRWLRHPNYVAVIGELLGVAWLLRSWIVGPIVIVGFWWLMARRIAVENRALGRL